MPKRSSKRDVNELAASIVGKATGEEPEAEEAADETPETTEDGKNAAAVALGRLGGLKGGKARADKLTAQKRSEIAKKAAEARWNGQRNKAQGG